MASRLVVLLAAACSTASAYYAVPFGGPRAVTSPARVPVRMSAGRAGVPCMQASSVRGGTRDRANRHEALIARGIAGVVLLRAAAASQAAAVYALVASLVVLVTPILALEAILLTGLFVVTGAANYWPMNLFTMLLGAAGGGGALHGVMQWWERQAARRGGRDAGKATRKRTESRGDAQRLTPDASEDGSGGLIVLVITTLTAAIVGALP